MNKKVIKIIVVISLASISILNLIACKSNVEVAKLSKEEATEQSESVNMDVIETTISLESSTQIEETTEIESSTQEIMEESLAESKEETQGETQEERQSEKQEETTTQETQKAKVQGKTGTDKNGHPYIDPEKYATWEQQPVDMNVLKRLRDEKVEKVYQTVVDAITDTPTEETLNKIRQVVEEEITFDGEETKNSYKRGLVFTFGADGAPIEAPAERLYYSVMNPNTGVTYAYDWHGKKWISGEGLAVQNVRAVLSRDGIMNAKGDTNLRKLTEEEMDRIAEGIAQAMGAE